MRQRRVDVESFARDLAPLDLRQRIDGAHVVEAVGELDEDDANVLRHRQEHLADVLGLDLLLGAEGDPAQLGDAVDEPCHLRPELRAQLLGGERRVLDGVVEKGGHDGRRVQLQLGQDGRHLERMVDVVLTRQALLAGMRGGRTLVRLGDQLLVGWGQVLRDPEQLGDAHLELVDGVYPPFPRPNSNRAET